MEKLAAVIIENRPTPGFVDIIIQHIHCLPKKSHLFLYGTEYKKHDGLIHALSAGGYGTHFHGFAGIGHIQSIDQYNLMLTAPEFWNDYLGFERVLIFQTDSMLLRNGIEDFFPYDYVGAPWAFQSHGGNGGLSLRNPRLMKEICEKYPFVPGADGNEDVYFCNHMHNKAIGNLAPREVCARFSVESIFLTGTLGYHAIDKYLSPEQCYIIKNQYHPSWAN